MPTNGSLSLVPSHGTLVLLLGFLVQLQCDGFYFVMFGCYLSEACSFLIRDRKEVVLDRRGDGEKREEKKEGKL